jgi:fluoride exporter
MSSFLVIAIGATLGAWSRWGLSLMFNHGDFPYGTLIANLIGAYLMGLAIAIFFEFPQINQEMKLLVTTGFLGGLTTFSTFSAEAFLYIQKHDYPLLISHLISNVFGSLICTFLGYLTVQLIIKHS